MVKKEELGKPAERLKETTAKLQLLALCNGKATNFEERSRGRDTMLEQMLAVAEERVRRLERNEAGSRGSRDCPSL